MSTTIVLPTYNERDNIVVVLQGIIKALPEAHILVIDDGSPDGTADLAEDFARSGRPIRVIRRDSKAGLGSAYRFAFDLLFADEHLDVDHIIVTMDSDLSHDPAVIPALVREIDNGSDVVIGSRYVDGGGTVDWPIHRRLLSRWGNRYTGWILGIPVKDCTSGFRAYRLGSLRDIDPRSTTAEGYAFLTELVLRLVRSGKRVTEIPIRFVDRTAGTSKMSGRIIAESMSLVTMWGIGRHWDAIRNRFGRSLRKRSAI